MRIVGTNLVLEMLRAMQEEGFSDISDAIESVETKNFRLEGDKGEIDLYRPDAKSELLLKKLKFSIKNSTEGFENEVVRITYSLKTKKVTFYFASGKSVCKRHDEVTFDILGVNGSELFDHLT